METITSPRHFTRLDELRGVAAFVVVLMHCNLLVLGCKSYFQHAYLAVDFFFMLSGFVLAHVYAWRMAGGLTIRQFMIRRLIRLYPTLAVGLLIGTVNAIIQAAAGGEEIARTVGLGAFALPALHVAGSSVIFPIDPPEWSLMWELAASFAFSLILWRVPRFGLIGVAIVAAVALAGFANLYRTLEIGFVPNNFYGGLARAAFAFPTGILLYRLHVGGLWSAPAMPHGLVVVLLILSLCAPSTSFRGEYDLLAVLLLFPLLIATSARGGAGSPLLEWAARISYPLYITHYPFILLIQALLAKAPLPLPIVFVIAVPAAILFADLTTRLFDEPVRRWVSARLMLTARHKETSLDQSPTAISAVPRKEWHRHI
jgi:peptidoglycan/LPS O-acetylase OafA/YrhL